MALWHAVHLTVGHGIAITTTAKEKFVAIQEIQRIPVPAVA
jgi:hypothetical protein